MESGENTPVNSPGQRVNKPSAPLQIGVSDDRGDPNLVMVDMRVLDDMLESKFACLAGSFLSTIRELRKELKTMRKENVRLREAVESLEKVSASSIGASVASVPEKSRLPEPEGGTNRGRKCSVVVKSPEGGRMVERGPREVQWSEVVRKKKRNNSNSDSKPVASRMPRSDVVPSSRNNTKRIAFGKASTSAELVKVKRKALFVSRFSATVSCDNLKELLNGLHLPSLEIKQLKTKHPSYSSFYISVNESDFSSINSPEVWPVGVLISPFYGSPKGRIIEPSQPPEDGAVGNHNG